jgi:hypothetical protein
MRRPGRAPDFERPEVIHVRMEGALKRRISAQAKLEGVTDTEWVRQACRERLSRLEELKRALGVK